MERELWQRLRAKQIDGYRFRKQHAVGRFIVDFFCPQAKLVVEVDGDSHALQADYDAERTQWLMIARHYRVLRFSNDEVHRNLQAVVERIAEELKRARCKRPPP